MKKNMSNIDRTIRILIAAAIFILWLADKITGTLAVILLIVAAVFVLTSFVGFCPLYRALGISSRKEEPGTPVAQ
jgi:hypothetical protein